MELIGILHTKTDRHTVSVHLKCTMEDRYHVQAHDHTHSLKLLLNIVKENRARLAAVFSDMVL